jgi:fumarylacetoacetase-like protein
MRLVTYDRGGARRLGAWVAETVVDLPDAVGHPVFPTTMEGLVGRPGGTTLEAAESALSDPEIVAECVVRRAKLLAPIRFSPLDGRGVYGPDDLVPWTRGAGGLTIHPELACVVGGTGRSLSRVAASTRVFGYSLMCHWIGREGSATSLGPWIVTADEFTPADVAVAVRVDGRPVWEGVLGREADPFPQMLALASRREPLRPGEVYGSGEWTKGMGIKVARMGACAVVELQAEGLGVLRTHLDRRAGQVPKSASGRSRRAR